MAFSIYSSSKLDLTFAIDSLKEEGGLNWQITFEDSDQVFLCHFSLWSFSETLDVTMLLFDFILYHNL